MSGRTSWWGKDAAWHRRELIVELGEEFGSPGPLVMDVLSCMAQEQGRGATLEGGVRAGFRSVAREAFTTPDEVRAIVNRAAEIGALDDLALDEDGRRFTCRVSGWRSDQERARASWRKAAQREREREPVFERDGWACKHCGSPDDLTVDHIIPKSLGGTDDLDNLQTLCGTCNRKKGASPPLSHGLSRSVTPSPQPDQTRPEKKDPPNPPGGTDFPVRPAGNRKTDVAAYDAAAAAWASENFPNAAPSLVVALAGRLRAAGHEPTPELMREYATEHPVWSAGIVDHEPEPEAAAA